MSILLSSFASLNYIKLLATKSLTLQHTFWWIIFDFANFDALKYRPYDSVFEHKINFLQLRVMVK